MTVFAGHPIAPALGLLAGALVVWPAERVGLPRRRWRRQVRRRWNPAVRASVVSGVGVVAAGALLSLPPWMVLSAGVLAALATRAVRRRPRPPQADEMRALAGDLDLLGTCLESGMPVGRAIDAVLSVAGRDLVTHPVRGPGGRAGDGGGLPDPRRVLAEVAALLALGGDPGSAWRPAARHPELAALAAAALRSALGGVRLADAARQSATELRRRCRRAAERNAARAGVAMTAPLALCFLPAFICLGLAPVVISLVSTLHIW